METSPNCPAKVVSAAWAAQERSDQSVWELALLLSQSRARRSAAMQLRLNPALDPAPFARSYTAQKAIQIPGLFEDALAYELETALLALPWRLICQNDAGQNMVLTRDEIAAMGAHERRALEDGIRRRAAENFGFTYFTYPMIEARLGNWN